MRRCPDPRRPSRRHDDSSGGRNPRHFACTVAPGTATLGRMFSSLPRRPTRRPVVVTIGMVPALIVALTACHSGTDSASAGSASPVVVVTETATVIVPPGGGPPTTITPTPAAQTPTGGGGNATQTATTPAVDTAAYAGDWIGHTRQMTLNPDGNGTMEVFSGASNGETWTVTWRGSGSGIAITLVSQQSSVGSGSGGSMYAGATYSATLQTDGDGVRYLAMTGFGDATNTVAWCSDRYGRSLECGA